VLQVGVNLHLVDVALSSLATVLVTLSLLFMSISALATWLVTGRALAPLETATRIATSITKADDLQRRIPLSGSSENEVNQLITAFNQTLERLEQLFNAQRRFLADVSHELRTPLTVIRGNVGLMRQMSELDEESLLGIETEVDRLSRMVGDLLLLAQAESGKLPLAMDPVALDTILLDVLQQMKLLNKGKLDIHLTDIDQIQVLGDADRLKQLLLNIIGNAVQYTPAKGRVLVGMRKVSKRVEISVSDNGPGISKEDLPHIFERFFRGEKSRSRSQSSGFGLGLSIAYWIARGHNGAIEVASEPEQGTTFTIWLPVYKPK
jgi:signal transduction histidine kinase